MKTNVLTMIVLLLISGLLACSQPLTTRETGAAIGGVGGAAAGGIIGSAVGHPGAGAAIGGALGLGTGALIGDRLQAMEQKQTDLEKQIKDNESELKRQRQELEILKKQSER